jgi:cold shock CspA family protein
MDPKVRKAISAESIEIGIPKREDIPNDGKRMGKVAFFNSSKGYGFIKDLETQENIFVHINAVSGEIVENDSVTFEMARGPKGWNAVNVKKN